MDKKPVFKTQFCLICVFIFRQLFTICNFYVFHIYLISNIINLPVSFITFLCKVNLKITVWFVPLNDNLWTENILQRVLFQIKLLLQETTEQPWELNWYNQEVRNQKLVAKGQWWEAICAYQFYVFCGLIFWFVCWTGGTDHFVQTRTIF